MPCWVVPTLAAEYWDKSLEQVLAGIDDGSIGHRLEHGFVLVDVAPHAQPFNASRHAKNEPAPETFVLVTPEEEAALAFEGEPAEVAVGAIDDADAGDAGDDDDRAFADDQHSEAFSRLDWARARQSAARLRRAPGSVPAPVAA